MRKSLQKILLFMFMMVSFSAMAKKNCEQHVKQRVAAGSVHHFLDDTDQRGEIEISAIAQVLSVHRQHFKSGHDACLGANSELPAYAVIAPVPVRTRSGKNRSTHLQLIFPFHYFW